MQGDLAHVTPAMEVRMATRAQSTPPIKTEADSVNGHLHVPAPLSSSALEPVTITTDRRRRTEHKRMPVPGFLTKAFEIFSNPAFSDVCGWGPHGDTVVIKKVPEFSQVVLPRYFKHSNFQSFVRQLNMYAFYKTVQDPNNMEFKHASFKRGQRHLLTLIKRKVPAGQQKGNDSDAEDPPPPRPPRPGQIAGTGPKSPPTDPSSQGGCSRQNEVIKQSDSALDELLELRKWKGDVEERMGRLEQQNRLLTKENTMLWQNLKQHDKTQREMQSKMQRILYCMYDVYVARGGPRLGTAGEGPPGADRSHTAVPGQATRSTSQGSSSLSSSIDIDMLDDDHVLGGLSNLKPGEARMDMLATLGPGGLNGAREAGSRPRISDMSDQQFFKSLQLLGLESPGPLSRDGPNDLDMWALDPGRVSRPMNVEGGGGDSPQQEQDGGEGGGDGSMALTRLTSLDWMRQFKVLPPPPSQPASPREPVSKRSRSDLERQCSFMDAAGQVTWKPSLGGPGGVDTATDPCPALTPPIDTRGGEDGNLVRGLSMDASTMLARLGHLGQAEEGTLQKIDSLGYTLYHLLEDPSQMQDAGFGSDLDNGIVPDPSDVPDPHSGMATGMDHSDDDDTPNQMADSFLRRYSEHDGMGN